VDEFGKPLFTPLVAYAFMLFILLYFPCIATVVAIGKEIGAKWAWFSVFYQTGIAWLISFLVFQIGSLF
jgi:ferrous iron transport protein B